MTKDEKDKLEAAVIVKHGCQPEWLDHDPDNACAREIAEIRRTYNRSRHDITKTKNLAKQIEKLAEAENNLVPVIVPDRVVDEVWFHPFSDKQKKIVKEWLKNTEQTANQLAKICGVDPDTVKKLMQSPAFKLLERTIRIEWMDVLPTAAIARLNQLLNSKNDNTAIKAVFAILMNKGYLKNSDVPKESDAPLDKETLEKLYEETNKMMGLDKKDNA